MQLWDVCIKTIRYDKPNGIQSTLKFFQLRFLFNYSILGDWLVFTQIHSVDIDRLSGKFDIFYRGNLRTIDLKPNILKQNLSKYLSLP